MPLYDLKCQACGSIREDVLCKIAELPAQRCTCGGPMQPFLGQSPSKVAVFKEGWYPHLASDPLYFSSKRKLKAYCREHGLTMDYLE